MSASMPDSASRSASGSGEPIAIIGMACRFPGANDIEAFWRLLETGGNAVVEGVPGSGVGRWGQIFGDTPVQSEGCRFGAFVDDIDRFDDAFFRISPVEAELLDPQQRMMLEVSWQALEDAGIDPDRLRESRTGVYSGISNDEYRMLVVDSAKPAEAAACLYALSGTNLNGTAGRVSFVLGLTGPAKAVDAACASAMVAINDAVADLQQGKANLALAGGVQAILNGRIYELRADAMMLSPDGQCKTFDASANGYVRAEGCGVVVLKRLSDAVADGDRIWAVIRGSVVNHGGTGVGLTVPNTPALEQVMEDALFQAGVDPLEVDYVEAHGTGTAVGDPIELNAVSSVYGKGRDARDPLLIGSVKTNVGHLESAAGVVGLIKAALVVRRGIIPKHLHFHDPNPAVDWDRMPLRVTSETMEWPDHSGRRRVAGVNCFGISGTNAHLVVEEYRGANGAADEGGPLAAGSRQSVQVSLPATLGHLQLADRALQARQARLLPLSGKSETALRESAGRYLSWLEERADQLAMEGADAEPLLSDMAWTAGVGRSHFDHRAGVVFRDAASLRRQLEAVTEGGDIPGPGAAGKVAFAYTGQGSQWVGMGRALYETEPVARAVLDRCESVVRAERGGSLLDVMFGRGGSEGELGDTAWEQPALYALGCALTALWSSVGVRPAVVVGHSVGELAAAQTAGVFSLEDGMRFACARGALMSGMADGAMAAVFAPSARVAAAVGAHNAVSGGVGLSISGDNGTHQVVSGPVEEIETISGNFDSEGIRVRRLNTRKAFHSALVEPILPALEESLEGVAVASPSLTVVSNLTGRPVESGQTLDGSYWTRHAREAVAFASGVESLAELGVDLVVEIGPRSVLAPMALSAWPESAGTPAPAVVSTLSPPSDDPASTRGGGDFAEAVAGAYEAGLPVRFEGLFAGEARRRIAVPGYPFQRRRHWLEAPRRRVLGAGHPLLGSRHETARGEVTFETELFPSDPEWLDDHRVFGRVVAPGALYGAMAVAASRSEGRGTAAVEDVQLHNALVFTEEDSGDGKSEPARRMQLVMDAGDPLASRRFQLFSRGGDEEWTMHVEGRVAPDGSPPEAPGRIDLDSLKARLSPMDVADYYRARAGTGVELGPSFRTLRRAWSAPGEALGEVSFPEGPGSNALDVHPLVLDGCFQVVGAARDLTGPHGSVTYLPFGWERCWLTTGRLPDQVLCHVRLNEGSVAAEANADETPEVLTGELRIYDPQGRLLGGLSGYTVKRATRAALLSTVEGVNDLLYEVVWRERALPPGMPPADFFPSPASIKSTSRLFPEHLIEAGVDPDDRDALLTDLEHWSWSYALATLDALGWRRSRGAVVDPETLREQLRVMPEHSRVFRRMLEMLAKSGVLVEDGSGFIVALGSEDPWPEVLPPKPDAHAAVMARRYSHGLTEVGLFRRSGGALPEVLRGREDPLTLLFSSGEPTAADLYLKAPVARAANRLLEEAVRQLVDALPEGRRLRVVEVGAGTGSATASVLPLLPEGRFDYMYTDISAGFFSEAEARFGDGGGCIEYRPLDIEKDPVEQGFAAHGYDLLLASNVLHATRYLEETLGHCRRLLAPSGQLVALENLSGLGWMDLTFGQLDGWWRFADDYRPHHALASPAVWRRALGDAGFEGVEVLGVDEADTDRTPDKGVIVAQGPAEVREPPGAWILAADEGGAAAQLASDLAARNQTVVLAGGGKPDGELPEPNGPGVFAATVEMQRRESWRSLIDSLPDDVPFSGVAHLMALDGAGQDATTGDVADDVERIGASALALAQGVADSGLTPEKGIWFVTRGAQVLERERGGELAGAVLWGFGKGVAREAAHLQPRMIDLDPGEMAPEPDLANELLYPDSENHVIHRFGRRRVARLIRAESEAERLALPEEPDWVLAPDQGGVFDRPYVQPLPARPLEPREVRVAVGAAGLNFWDVFRSLGFIEEGLLGREMCGRIVEIGAEVSRVSVGDHVVGMGFGAFGPMMITHEELVASAPTDISQTGLATIPSAFVSAALSFEYSGLEPGERVLIHAGAGGVGLAAIQWVQAAGAEVYATASARKQAYLRSLGVRACVRQPHHGVRRRDPRGDGWRRGRHRAEQPYRRGLHRRQPGLSEARGPLRGDGPARHSDRGRDGGGPSGRLLRHPGAGRPEEDRSGVGREGVARCDGAHCRRRTRTDRPQPMAAGRGGRGAELHALGPASREDRRDRAPALRWPAAPGRHLSGDGRPGRDRVRRGRMARGPGRGGDRAQRAPRAGRSRRGDHPRAQGTRGDGRGRVGGCGRSGRAGPHAGRHGPASAPARGRDPQRGRALRRRAHQPDLGEVRTGAPAQDPGCVASAPRDGESRPGHVRPLLEPGRGHGQSRPGEPCRRQCIPGPVGRTPARAGARGTGDRLGGVVGDRRGGRAARTDRPAPVGARRALVHASAGTPGIRSPGASGCDDVRGDGDGLVGVRGGRGRASSPAGGAPVRGIGCRGGLRGRPEGRPYPGERSPRCRTGERAGVLPPGRGAGRAAPAVGPRGDGRVLRSGDGFADGRRAAQSAQPSPGGKLHGAEHAGLRLPGHRLARRAPGGGTGRRRRSSRLRSRAGACTRAPRAGG